MKNVVLPFTCLKLHFEGEAFAPVQANNAYELQSALSVLCGIKGNPYGFASAENAQKWLDSTLVKTSQSGETKQAHIDKLELQNSVTPNDYLQTEINNIQARNNGEWNIYFSDDLLVEWGIIAKGDKGDTGAAGENGQNGAQGAQGIQGIKGDTGLQGAQGIQGAQGAQGIQGVKGDKGDTGAAGASGITWQFPIGYILIDVTNTNPNTFLGYGTWSAYGAGRVLVGQDTTQTEFDVLEETGGAKTHVLSVGEMPSHTHLQNAHNHGGVKTGGGGTVAAGSALGLSGLDVTAVNQNTGGSGAHNNLQPYLVVKFWKRTA